MEKTATASGSAEDFHIEDWPFYWLTRFTGRYIQQMEIELKRIGLDVPRWRVLMSLRDNSKLSVSDIANHAIVKLPTMTKIIQRMHVEGLVHCSQSGADGRVTEVELTDDGKLASQRAWTVAHKIYRRAFENVTDKEVTMLNRLLRTISRSMAE